MLWGHLMQVALVILMWTHTPLRAQAEAAEAVTAVQDAEAVSSSSSSRIDDGDEDSSCAETGDQSQLNSFLWTLKRDPPAYFFGTIHVPYTRVWKYIAENMKEAFMRADNVYFELDLTDPYTISALANCQLLPQGEYLSNVIPRPLYRRLKRHLEYVKLMMPNWMTPDQRGQGLYADYLFNAITGNWERKRPVWVMMMVNSLTESDIRTRGVPVLDLYLAQEASRMEKETGAVEEVDEQCVPLNELDFSQVVFALNATLWQHENSRLDSSLDPYTTDDLIEHYNCGNLNSVIFNRDTAQVPNLVNNTLPPEELNVARQTDQYFRQELIYKRNQRMADRIDTLLAEHPNESFFFAFGAGHFLGNHTVIEKLKVKGYELEHTLPTDNIYLGEHAPRRRRKHQRLMADMEQDFPVPPVLISGNIQYLDPYYDRRRLSRHRNRQNRRKGRRKEGRVSPTDSYHLKRPQFNDLWVRLESTSFGPNSYFRRQQPSPTTATTEQPPPVYAMYNTAASPPPASLTLTLLTCVLLWSLTNCGQTLRLLS